MCKRHLVMLLVTANEGQDGGLSAVGKERKFLNARGRFQGLQQRNAGIDGGLDLLLALEGSARLT
jgi:hypothetical protein